MSFDRLGLSPELLRAVAGEGYTEPTPVQAQAIPLVLAGRDVMAGAQTGTGKTAAFVLPILDRLAATRRARPASDPRARRPRVLVLVPTRELALQVEESVRTYGKHRPVRSVAIYGGVGYGTQVRALRQGVEIVVATPGRLLDHLGNGDADLSAIEILVLDEADRMLDMGFIRDIRRILATLPAERQGLLFSATFSKDIRELAASFLREPATVQVDPANRATDLVRQVVIRVDRERKRELLTHLVGSGRIDQALVFARTKHGADRLAKQLVADGIEAAAIHGNRSQGQRVRALDDFKAGRVQLLVATEVAARGIDIEELPHVVNYELPMVAADYVHRIGRTGRAGAQGDAISLVCVDEAKLLREIEGLLGARIETEIVEGFAPDRSIRPEAIRLRTGGAGHMAPRPAPSAHVARPARPAARVPHRNAHAGVGVGGPRPAARPDGRGPRPAAPRGFDPRTPAPRPMAPWARERDGHPPVASAGNPRALPGERLRRTQGV